MARPRSVDLEIIDVLVDRYPTKMRLTNIASHIRRRPPPSSLQYPLSDARTSLRSKGYVERDEDGRYCLDSGRITDIMSEFYFPSSLEPIGDRQIRFLKSGFADELYSLKGLNALTSMAKLKWLLMFSEVQYESMYRRLSDDGLGAELKSYMLKLRELRGSAASLQEINDGLMKESPSHRARTTDEAESAVRGHFGADAPVIARLTRLSPSWVVFIARDEIPSGAPPFPVFDSSFIEKLTRRRNQPPPDAGSIVGRAFSGFFLKMMTTSVIQDMTLHPRLVDNELRRKAGIQDPQVFARILRKAFR